MQMNLVATHGHEALVRDLYSKFETGAAKYEGFDEDDIRRVKSTEIRWATEDNMHFSNFKSMYEKRAKEFRDRNRPRTSGNTTPAGLLLLVTLLFLSLMAMTAKDVKVKTPLD